MTKIKLALCQMNVIDDKEANLKKATSMITDSANKNADFIVLPEMFNCPYSNDKFIEYGEHEDESITLKAISELAGENNVHILAGSIPEYENDNLYNTSYLFDRTGTVIAKLRRIELLVLFADPALSVRFKVRNRNRFLCGSSAGDSRQNIIVYFLYQDIFFHGNYPFQIYRYTYLYV